MRLLITTIGLLFLSTTSINSYAQRNAIDSLQKALNTADDTSKTYINYFLGKKYLRISKDTCRDYINVSVELAKKDGNDKILAESYSILGALEKYQGNYETALSYHLKALKIKELLNNEYGLTVTYNDIGIIYKNMKRWDEALEFYRKSNEMARKIDLGMAISFTYSNLGTVYNELDKYDSAMLSYSKALSKAKEIKNTGAIATALSNLADVQFAHKKYDSALNNFRQCLYYDRINEDKYGMSQSHMQLGRTYSVLEKHKQALAHIDSADRLAKEQSLLRVRIDILKIKSSIEEKAGLVSKAILSIRKSDALKDSILNEETTKQISELQTKYETEKKEQQIALQQSEISRKNVVIYSIGGLLLLAILLGYSYYRRYQLKQQAKLQQAIIEQQELATKAVIEAEEKERTRIASDLHDGVGQLMSAARVNLSIVNSQIKFNDEDQKVAFEKALALVDDSCTEVRGVSHNIMPNALLKNGLATAIRDFIGKIDSKVIEVNLYTEGLNERLASNTETILYRVIQECVNNVIKHAAASKLDITLIKDDDGISVTIEDNGKGFDTKVAFKKDGIGLQNMVTRIEYLKGSIEWDTAVGNGTVVTIDIPNV